MERGYTVQQAAARLGVSAKTVRKRIAAGELRADLNPGPRGPQYTVWLDDGTLETTVPTDNPPAPTLPVAVDPRLDALLALPDQVDQIRNEMRDLSEMGQKVVASDLERVVSLLEGQAAEIAHLRAELAESRRPWWKRWRR